MTIPNLLTVLRLASLPLLVCLTWLNQRELFLVVLTFSLVTDALDGFIARKLKQVSELGTRLDTYADFVTYITVPVLALYLWTDVIRREAPFVIAVFVSSIVPVILGLLKYGRLPSYHTWGAKLSAVLMGITCLIMFSTGVTWPFRMATPVLFLASFEEIAITAIIPRWHPNVASVWHAKKIARRMAEADAVRQKTENRGDAH